jgi:hypothetical protein
MNRRYDQLLMIINQFKPKFIAEIGTHRGARAEKIVECALANVSSDHIVTYHGYDVFETRDLEFQIKAMNGKGVARENQATLVLQQIAEKHKNFDFELIVGDTRDTLRTLRPTTYDFVFIDGDHRVEVIQSDYNNVKESKVVVFDDFYRADSNGKSIDVTKYGCNKVLEQIDQKTHQIIILPEYDQLPSNDLIPGGRVYLAAVVRKN